MSSSHRKVSSDVHTRYIVGFTRDYLHYGILAQQVEHLLEAERVVGSIPTDSITI